MPHEIGELFGVNGRGLFGAGSSRRKRDKTKHSIESGDAAPDGDYLMFVQIFHG